jgi:hypothetical protein
VRFTKSQSAPIGDGFLDHDAPEQRRRENEYLFLLLANPLRPLQAPDDEKIRRQGKKQAGQNPKRGAEIAPDSQTSRGGPRCHRRRDHDRAVRQVEHAGDAEDQREARRA